MIGVGLSQNADTRAAVREAFARARFSGRASWVLAVAGRRHDAESVFAVISDLLPGVPVYGGACVGAIGAKRIGYSGYEVALAVFDDALGLPDVFLAEPIAEREHEAGRDLGAWLATQPDAPGALLFYDVTREGGGINFGSRLLDGIYAALPEGGGPPVFGAGLITDFQVTESFLFDGTGVRRNAALALRFPDSLQINVRIMHGCTPVSTLLEVTRAEGARIHELDGRPAADVLRELAGAKDGEELALAFSVLLGRRAGDPLSPYEEAEYINRLIIDVDAADGSVSLFEEDIRTGDKVQVMVRNNSLLMDSVESGARASVDETATHNARFGLYIDCAGRASVFTGSESEESEHLLKQIGNAFPVLGFYVGREIAPFDGRSRPLDWTGVLTVFSVRDEQRK
ncbi:MAG TPA: FIST N-terminal domain-containing protein [Gammaproteobacteria bacterium]